MGSKFYGKKKAVSDKELDEMLASALDTEQSPTDLVQGTAVEKTMDTKFEEIKVSLLPEEQIQHKAYNTYYDGKAKKFLLITIGYDPLTDQCSVISKEPIADNIAVALYKLNGIITNKLMRGEESV